MKAKILIGLLLWIIGAIYVFLVYPLLQSPESITLNEVNDTGEEINDLDSSVVSLSQNDEPVASSQQPAVNTICFNSHCFTIEIADTPDLRAQWLMNRESLPEDAGMLFVFDIPGSYGFWMKNTLIPLDIIRLDEDFVVVDTATMLPCTTDPCPNYNHSGQAMYALEINAWLVEQYDIEIWDMFIQK